MQPAAQVVLVKVSGALMQSTGAKGSRVKKHWHFCRAGSVKDKKNWSKKLFFFWTKLFGHKFKSEKEQTSHNSKF